MRHRYGNFLLEGKNISALDNYLTGFQTALDYTGNNHPESLLPLPFGFFNSFVANYYKRRGWSIGWRRIILQETHSDEEKGFEAFYEIFDEFKKLSIQQCQFAVLSKANIKYHHSEKSTYKRYRVPNEHGAEPLFDNPNKVFVIQLSDDMGYLCMVNTDSKHRLERWIYNKKSDVDEFVERNFGKVKGWKSLEADNIDLYMEIEH